MSDKKVSLDEFLSERKGQISRSRSGDEMLVKASRAASSWNKDKRSIRFVMSTEQEDRDRDILKQEGIRLDNFLENPQAYFNHSSESFPVGMWSDVQKNLTGRPKRTEGTLTLLPEGEEESADRLARHLAYGSIRACSIGFLPLEIKRRPVPDDKQDVDYYWPGYFIDQSELLECSAVTIPANPGALAKAAIAGDNLAYQMLEETLDLYDEDPVLKQLINRQAFEAAMKDVCGNRRSVYIPEGIEAQNVGIAQESKSEDDHSVPAPDRDKNGNAAELELPEGEDKKLTSSQAKSLLGKIMSLLDLVFPENKQKSEQKLREDRMAQAHEAVRIAMSETVAMERRALAEKRTHELASKTKELGFN